MNRDKEIEKQAIEEMAYSVCRLENKPENCASCMWKASCENYLSAENYYTEGYRRQIEAEWVAKKEMYRTPSAKNYYCSNCAKSAIFDSFMGVSRITKYCPDCGAHMKGGAE